MSALGTMILSGKAALSLNSTLEPGDFYRPVHRTVFKALRKLLHQGREIDFTTLEHALGKDFSEVGGMEYMIQLAESCPNAKNFAHYGGIVLDFSSLRRLEESASDVLRIVDDPDLETSEKVGQAQALFGTIRSGTRPNKHVSDVLDAMSDKPPVTLQTCWPTFDSMTSFGGFTKGEPHMIAGGTGSGKSLLASQLARKWALVDGHSVVVVTLELSEEFFVRRMLFQETGVWSKSLAEKRGMSAQYQAAENAMRLSDLEIFDYANVPRKTDRTTEAILGDLRAYIAVHRVDAVIVDYVQLLSPGSKKGDYRDDKDTATELKWFAKQTGVCLACCSQEKFQNGRLETRGSKEYDDIAATKMSLTRETKEALDRITYAKARHGKMSYVDVPLREETLEFLEMTQTRIG